MNYLSKLLNFLTGQHLIMYVDPPNAGNLLISVLTGSVPDEPKLTADEQAAADKAVADAAAAEAAKTPEEKAADVAAAEKAAEEKDSEIKQHAPMSIGDYAQTDVPTPEEVEAQNKAAADAEVEEGKVKEEAAIAAEKKKKEEKAAADGTTDSKTGIIGEHQAITTGTSEDNLSAAGIEQVEPKKVELPTPGVVEKKPIERDPYEADLLEEERDQLDLLRFGEEKDPTKYKGSVAKALAFFKAQNEKINELISANDSDPDYRVDDDPKLKAFQRTNKPGYTQKDIKQLDRLQMQHEIMAELKAGQAADLEPVKAEQFRAKQIPVAQELYTNFQNGLSAILPDDMKKVFLESGENAAVVLQEKFPIEYQEVLKVSDAAKNFAEAWISINQGLTTFNQANKVHLSLFEFIGQNCQDFKANATDKQKTNNKGQTFLDRGEYFKLTLTERKKHWTVDTAMGLTLITGNAKEQTTAVIKSRLEELEKAGFSRTPETPPAKKNDDKPPAKKDDGKPPKGRTTILDGASPPAPPAENESNVAMNLLHPKVKPAD